MWNDNESHIDLLGFDFLVDSLVDRCATDTIVATFETIRLFLNAPKTGSPAVPVGRVRRPNGRHTASRRTRRSTPGVFSPDESSSASRQEKCLLSGRLRPRNLDRDPEAQPGSPGRPPGPSAASRAAAPLDGPEKRSYEVRFEHPPATSVCDREMPATTGYLGCSWAFTDPREQQERPISKAVHDQLRAGNHCATWRWPTPLDPPAPPQRTRRRRRRRDQPRTRRLRLPPPHPSGTRAIRARIATRA
jgi:hypothetical protein